VASDLDMTEMLDAPALTRLRGIGFMGILGSGLEAPGDNRFDHSIGVALAADRIATGAGLSRDERRILFAASLLHDAANRALSHTCEGSFNRIARTSSADITWAILFGSHRGWYPGTFV